MKVIDLLNKIASGEDVPQKIKWGEHYLTWFVYEHKALDELGDPNIFECAGGVTSTLLNDEIEIIEDTQKENKKIEKLDNNIAYCVGTYETRWSDSEMYIVDKINEIIDKVNGENNED